MSEIRRKNARALFEEALERPQEEQDMFLEEACGGDPLLEKEVRSLLEAHRNAGGFLQSGLVAEALAGADARGQDPMAGTVIGSYTVIDLLGRGGMGAVYRAEQDSPRREVALKLVDRMIVTPELSRRFEVEAQVLAKLHHPGIAHIYETGTTETDLGGRPYFAMELIDGQSITSWADRNGLGRRARLELMIKVCEAVQHAHRVGVIHRDLKPANILVDQDGQPKILDFGVARSTDTDLQVTTMVGSQAVLIGTLPYMSPEQVRGDPDDLDTRSDVYALGVLCYELLTGKLPRDLEGKTLTDAIRIIAEEDPKTLGSMARGRFPADLETIVATALAGEKERRYGSASDLAGDIKRFLAGHPINARPQGAGYQLRKLILRNRLASSLVAGIVIISLGFAVAMGFQARRVTRERDLAARERDRANQEAETAIEVSRFLESLFESVDLAREKATEWTPQKFLDRGAERIEEELQDQPVVRARLLVLMGEAYGSMGLFDRKKSMLQEAVDIGRGLAVENQEAAVQAKLVEGLQGLASQISEEGEKEEALAMSREALALVGSVHGVDSLRYAECLNHLGAHLRWTKNFEEAREVIEQGLELRKRILGPEHIDVAESKRQLAWLLYDQGEMEQCSELLAELCEQFENALEQDDPRIARCHIDQLNVLSAMKNYEAAIPHCEKVLPILREQYGPDSLAVGVRLYVLGWLKAMVGEAEESYRYYLDSVETFKRSGNPGYPRALQGLAGAANSAIKLNDRNGAEAALRERLDLALTYHADNAEVVKEAQERLDRFLAEGGR